MKTIFGDIGMISSGAKGLAPSANDDPLEKLAEQWELSARKQFECGERTGDPMGKRLVEHGAVVLFNCASELRAYLASL